ncbi:MAG: LTA synthase family protein [Pseudomonadota bacterium]
MIDIGVAFLVSVLSALVADGLVSPRHAGLRSSRGVWTLALFTGVLFGVFLAVSGTPALAAVLTSALHFVAMIASNAKRRVLGEPLLFSDFAVVGAMVTHPQFYFSVLALWQQIAGGIGAVALVAVLAWLFEPSVHVAGIGLGLAAASLALLALSAGAGAYSAIALKPDAEADVVAHGLWPTILIYWMRWRASKAALKRAKPAARPSREELGGKTGVDDLLIVVQCESFADPAHLFAEGGIDLPHLARARETSAQWGNLEVSGFGAYTMRTEFGVLFGRSDAELGFRLYDPYLTARDEAAPALPQMLGARGWRSLFVHPHDMRFYSRHQILPKAGFAELIGEDRFAKPTADQGRYVTDAAVADKLLELAHAARGPTMLYAVTMENHGPWAPRGDASPAAMVANYNRRVEASDAMLGQLLDGLAQLERPTTLVFFGDHRPTIPGASDPGGDKHTPYLIVPFGQEALAERRDLTPAQLHEAIVQRTLGSA